MTLACSRLAIYASHWVRMPECWSPPASTSAHVVWCDFVAHLLHQYPAPSFFAPMWLEPFQETWQRDLHFHIGQGKSIRRFDIPDVGKVSKTVARWFMQAPAHAEVPQAIRWAQARAAGADEKLASILMHHLHRCSKDNWEKNCVWLIEFMILNQPISEHEMESIITFVLEQRFKPARQTVGAWMGNDPVDKNLNVRRRSLRRMRRHIAHWREAFPAPVVTNQLGWHPTSYCPLVETHDNLTWILSELCTPRQLRLEGRRMKHCVGTYVDYCRRGECSIWTLRCLTDDDRLRSVMTVDVQPKDDRILDAKGKANSEPTEFAMGMLGRWAAREGLTFTE